MHEDYGGDGDAADEVSNEGDVFAFVLFRCFKTRSGLAV
jgi:hypothetical protein